MKFLIIFFLLCLLLTFNCYASTSISIQEGKTLGYSDELYEGAADTKMHVANPNELWCGEFILNGRFRSLVKFDISFIPTGATITSATLRMYCSVESVATDYTIKVHKCLTNWSAGDCTWNQYNVTSALNWGAAGGLSGTDYTATATDTETYVNTGVDLDFTVTTDVQAWVNGTSSNYGWFMIGQEDGTNRTKQFSSHLVSTVANRPELLVTYTTGGTSNDVIGILD